MNPKQFQNKAYELLSKYGCHDWKVRWWKTPNISLFLDFEFALTSHKTRILTFSLNVIEALNEEYAIKLLNHEMAHVLTGDIQSPHGAIWRRTHKEAFGEEPLESLQNIISSDKIKEITESAETYHLFCSKDCTPFLGKPLEEIKKK